MTDKEKLTKAVELGDAMYHSAQQMTSDASYLHKAMKDWWHFINYELNENDNDK